MQSTVKAGRRTSLFVYNILMHLFFPFIAYSLMHRVKNAAKFYNSVNAQQQLLDELLVNSAPRKSTNLA